MKISELILLLEKVKKEKGDLKVVYPTGETYNHESIDEGEVSDSGDLVLY